MFQYLLLLHKNIEQLLNNADVSILFLDKPVTSSVVLSLLQPKYSEDVGHRRREVEETAYQQLIVFLHSLDGNNEYHFVILSSAAGMRSN
jgi:hypothetical protein